MNSKAQGNKTSALSGDGPKHTPGPWTARDSFSCPSDYDSEMMDFACSVDCIAPFTDDVKDSDQYGQTFDEQACARAYGRSKDEAQANAHLIAAAPLMFDYIAKRAEDGDMHAAKIMEHINAGRR